MGEMKIEGLGLDELKDLLEYTYKFLEDIARGIAEELLRPEWAEKEAVFIATYYKTLRQQGLNPSLAGKLTLLRVINLKLFFKELAKYPGEVLEENLGTTD